MRKDKEDGGVIKDAKKVMLDGPAKVAARAVVEKIESKAGVTRRCMRFK